MKDETKPEPKTQLVTDGEKWAIKQQCEDSLIRYFDFILAEAKDESLGIAWWKGTDRFWPNCWTTKEIADKWYKRLLA